MGRLRGAGYSRTDDDKPNLENDIMDYLSTFDPQYWRAQSDKHIQEFLDTVGSFYNLSGRLEYKALIASFVLQERRTQ